MKKKILIFAVILIIAILSLTGCGTKDEINTDKQVNDSLSNGITSNNGNNQNSELTASITVPDGWNQTVENTWWNGKLSSSIVLGTTIIPLSVKTTDDYITHSQNNIKEVFKDAVFGNVSHTKVGGIDAVEYTYTVKVGEPFKYRLVSILKDGKAYMITCSSTESNYDTANKGFQTAIDSYELK